MRLPATPLATTEPACCCPARPVVTVMLPPDEASGRGPVDLLLCGHHFNASRKSLEATGAIAFDARGELMLPFGGDIAAEWRLTQPVGTR